MATRKFQVSYTVTATIEVDDTVIEDALTDDWCSQFYPFHTASDVVSHIAYNSLRDNASLSELDGFAHLDDKQSQITKKDWEPGEVEEGNDAVAGTDEGSIM